MMIIFGDYPKEPTVIEKRLLNPKVTRVCNFKAVYQGLRYFSKDLYPMEVEPLPIFIQIFISCLNLPLNSSNLPLILWYSGSSSVIGCE